MDGTLVGSYRRGAADSGDIDVLLLGGTRAGQDKFKQLVTELKDSYILETLASGPKKFMGICQLDDGHPARRLDLLLTPPEEYACAIFYFTGSQAFNIAVRKRALELGYTLNEHALTSLDAAPPPPVMKTERDIFEFLKIKYVSPENRVDENSLQYV